MQPISWKRQFADLIALMRLDKPIGILLLLWPTLWAVWIASAGRPTVSMVIIFVLGTILTRSGGCVLNDLADRKFDGRVKRTANRPLVTGRIGVGEAVIVAIICFMLAGFLILSLSSLTIQLAFVALFLAATYPFMKRLIAIPQAYLGLAFSFGIPMAFAAIRDDIPTEAWILFAAGAFWSIAYDTEYAMADREDDLKIGIKTSAITFGRFDSLAVVICYGVMQGLLILAGQRLGMGMTYYVGLAAALALMVYHYGLIRKGDPAKCFHAFRHNGWVGMVIFIGIAADYVMREMGYV